MGVGGGLEVADCSILRSFLNLTGSPSFREAGDECHTIRNGSRDSIPASPGSSVQF